jgi:hypothetical protein
MITKTMIERRLNNLGIEITPEHKRIMNMIWSKVPLTLPPMTLMPPDVPDEYPGTAAWIQVIMKDQPKVNTGGVLASLDLPF